MTDIFISYSRKDTQFAKRIVHALADNNLDTWVDWMSIPKGEDWQQEIYRGIEEADTFLFLISPDSVASEACNTEINHAIENGKRILPVFISKVENHEIYEVTSKFPNKENEKQINLRNFVFCREAMDDFQKAMEDIKKTIHTDYEWLKFHTKLQNKALDWHRHKNSSRLDGSRLLRGKELREARQQLAKTRIEIYPLPTAVQQDYLIASSKREKLVRTLLVIGVLVLSIAALIAYLFKGETEQQRGLAGQKQRLARSRELANLSSGFLNQYPDRSRLLAIEAVRQQLDASEPVAPEAAHALRNSIGDLGIRVLEGNFGSNDLQVNNRVPKILAEQGNFISDVQFSPNNQWFASSDGSGTVFLWRRNESTGTLDEPVSFSLSSNTTNLIRGLSFSPDSRWLAAVSDSGVYLLDLHSSHPTFVEKSNHSWFLVVKFSPDSHYLISGGYGLVKLWDLNLPSSPSTELKITEGEDVWTLAVTPDGQWLAAGSINSSFFTENQGSIYLWQLSQPQENAVVLQVPDGRIKSLAFSPDGRWLASASFEVRLWDMQSLGSTYVTLAKLPTLANEILFSPDGRWLAGAFSNHNFIRVWDLTTDDFPAVDLEGHSGEIDDLAFSADSTLLASASLDHDVRIWNLSDNIGSSGVFKGNEFEVLTVAFSPDGQWLASGGNDARVRLWDVMSNSLFNQADNPIAAMTLCPIDSRIAASYDSGDIKVWDVNRMEDTGTPDLLQTPMGPLATLFFSPQCTWLAGQTFAGDVLLWNMSGGMPTPISLKTETGIAYFAFDPDEKSIAAALWDGRLQLWSLRSPDAPPVSVTQNHMNISQLDFSGDGRWLIWGEPNGEQFVLRALDTEAPAFGEPIELHAFDLPQQFVTTRNGSWIATLDFDELNVWYLEPSFENLTAMTSYDPYEHKHNPFTSFGFSQNGDFLAVGMQDGLVNVMDMFSLDSFALAGHTDRINAMAFSHGGLWLVTGSNDNTVRLWDMNAPGHGEVFSGFTDGIVDLGFTGNDQWIVTRSRNSDLVLWLADLEAVLNVACKNVSRNLTADEWSLYFPGEPYRTTCSNLPSLVNLEQQEANQQVSNKMENWFLRVQLMIFLVLLLTVLSVGVLLFVAIRIVLKRRSISGRHGRTRIR